MARPLRVAGAALCLTLLFCLVLFPWQRFRAGAEAQLSGLFGSPVSVGEVGPAIGAGGLTLRLGDVRGRLAGGERIEIDELRVRPAFSTSWLSGDPAFALRIAAPVGAATGTLYLGGTPGYRGTLEGVDLEWVSRLLEGPSLAGRADVVADLFQAAEGLDGEVVFSARDGALTLPPYGLPLPFATAEGEVEFLPETGAVVKQLQLDDPTLSLGVEGTVGSARGRLDLRADLQVRDPGLRSLVGQAVRLDGEGRASLRVGGTLADPVVR